MTAAPSGSEPVAAWHAVAVRYPYEADPAVGPVSLTIERGERVLLLGPSGCGKSTLLLSLTGLVPASIPAERTGAVTLAGAPVESRQPAEWADTVAQFFQDADQTLCGMRVEDEIAFALENRAVPEAEICARVAATMRIVGIPDDWRERRTMTLSGGEKQLVALAATLVQEAPLFVADEPTAHLAPAVAARLHALLTERAENRAVLIVDHRLDGLLGSIDRVVALGGNGRVSAEGAPRAFFREHRDVLEENGIWRPLASHLDAALDAAGLAAPCPPLTVAEALDHLPMNDEAAMRARGVVADFLAGRMAVASASTGEGLVRLENADCAPFLGPIVLRDVSMELHAGEVLGVLGPNGAGKTTLGACLAGILRLKGGRRSGPAGGIAFQKPETQFTEASALEEVASALPSAGSGDRNRDARALLADWGLEGAASRHPYELSQGQKRRLALATLTAGKRWPFVVLDELQAGLDARGTAQIVADVERLARAGYAAVLITHDMDLALRLCPRSIVVGEGGLIAEGATADLLVDLTLLARAGLAEPAVAPVLRWLDATRPHTPC